MPALCIANEITGSNFNDHTFRVSRTNYHDAVNQCEYMATQYKTYVQIAPDYAFGWGGAQGPDCSGFALAQLQALDFSRMDLTEFYAEIAPTLPDVGALRQKAQQRVNSYFGP